MPRPRGRAGDVVCRRCDPPQAIARARFPEHLLAHEREPRPAPTDPYPSHVQLVQVAADPNSGLVGLDAEGRVWYLYWPASASGGVPAYRWVRLPDATAAPPQRFIG